MDYYIDYFCQSINKFGEELCGDNIEIVKKNDGIILVLADGLGSGVKANILATLTSKIAVTMLKEGLSIEETIDTITNTLPVCSKRQLAYSTFTIIDMKYNGEVYMIEYENPSSFYYNQGNKFDLVKKHIKINDKEIRESYFNMKKGDFLVIVSDGVIHAGVGELLNLGWQWNNVNDYLGNLIKTIGEAKNITQNLISSCKKLYNDRAGDDTTVCTITLKEKIFANLFIGPPKDPQNDKILLENFKNAKGFTIVSGGTTANIIARELGTQISVDFFNYSKDLPPIGFITGVDLVTEGLLTLNRVVDLLSKNDEFNPLEKDGANRIINIFNQCTDIKIYLGKAINVAHQNPDLPEEFNLKAKVVRELKNILEIKGKVVEIEEI